VQHWFPPLLARVKAHSNEPLPALTDALYQDFFRDGTRLPFENIYFERRRQLGQTAIALLLNNDTNTQDQLLPSFLNKLNDVLDECSWALPAHINTPSGKDPLVVDLFAAETANNMAEMLVTLNAMIPSELATRIQDRLHRQIFENYINRAPAFGWTTLDNNWNAVCHQGVLGAALSIENDHELVARILIKAAAALPKFLSGFCDDGSTSEGPGYWSYGFGWFSELNAQLEHRTDGQLSFFQDDPKIARIAHFAPQMSLSHGHLVNFSDSHRKSSLNPSLLSYLGQRLDDSTLQQQAVALYRDQATKAFDFDALRCDFFNLSRLALRASTTSTASQTTASEPTDVYFPDYGAIVTRGTDSQGHRWEFAAKAGHNAEHHNHNDCGSWLLNIDNKPCMLEIGAPEYVKDFFRDETRYTFIAARSLGHSVPYINECEQGTGREFAAKVLHADVGKNRVEFSIDLTDCYPAEADCTKLHRHWVLNKDAGLLTITDHYQLKQVGRFESLLITLPTASRDGKDAIVQTDKNRIRIRVGQGTQITTIDTCDYRGHHGTDETVDRIRIAPNEVAASGTLTYTISID
jgi:hypothetical protein